MALLIALLLATRGSLGAQQPDSTVVAPPVPRAAPLDTVAGPPISPGRAFFSSLLLPGYGQAKLNRGTAGALFVFIEALSITMWLKSAGELDFARQHGDAVIVDYSRDCTGAEVPDGLPCVLVETDANGEPTTVDAPNRYAGGRLTARRQHVEDWVALLLANHLLAGADAYVAAHLWDLPGRLSIRPTPQGGALGVSFTW